MLSDLYERRAFNQLQRLDLSGSSMLTDVTALAPFHLHSMIFDNCMRLVNVKGLGKHTTELHFANCASLVDANSLIDLDEEPYRLKVLNLRGCSGVTNVSKLGEIYSLNLDHVSLQSLEGVDWRNHKLRLRRIALQGEVDLSILHKVKDLRIDYRKSYRNFQALKHVPNLKIDGLTVLMDSTETCYLDKHELDAYEAIAGRENGMKCNF